LADVTADDGPRRPSY